MEKKYKREKAEGQSEDGEMKEEEDTVADEPDSCPALPSSCSKLSCHVMLMFCLHSHYLGTPSIPGLPSVLPPSHNDV